MQAGVPEPPSEAQLVDMLANFQCNNFGITDDLLIPIGAGVYPEGALLNHSCDPNCVVTYAFNEATLQYEQYFRCLRAVREGEELCHSYLDPMATTDDRRERLQSTYCFLCTCPKCVGPPPSSPSHLALDVEYCALKDGRKLVFSELNLASEVAVDLAAADELYVWTLLAKCLLCLLQPCVMCQSSSSCEGGSSDCSYW